MKLLITGASGSIGGVILEHALQRPEITRVVVATRKPFTTTTTNAEKLENVIIPDFGQLDDVQDTTWNTMLDVDAIVWAVGTYDVNIDVNLNYPLAFQHAFTKRLLAAPQRREQGAPKIKFLLLSGAFVVRDQSSTLYWMQAQRKNKGELENKTIEHAETNRDFWEAYIFKPGGIMFGGDTYRNRIGEYLFGTSLAIRSEELAAFVADLIVNGSEKKYILNDYLVARGRELLAAEK